MPSRPSVLCPFGEDTMRLVGQNLARALADQTTQAHVVYLAAHYRQVFDEGDRWCMSGTGAPTPR